MPLNEIESLEERLRLAMISSDVNELEALLAPELVFTTFLGERITRADDLAAHRSGFLKIHAVVLSDTIVRQVGEAFVVTCLAAIDATFNEERTAQDFRFTRVWRPLEGGSYAVTAGQATLVYATL